VNTDPRASRWGACLSSYLSLLLSRHLVLQRKGSDCWMAGPVVVTLRHLGVQNAKRDSEHEGSDDDYAFGHHGKPPRFWVTFHA
jgi:hypothetical protein